MPGFDPLMFMQAGQQALTGADDDTLARTLASNAGPPSAQSLSGLMMPQQAGMGFPVAAANPVAVAAQQAAGTGGGNVAQAVQGAQPGPAQPNPAVPGAEAAAEPSKTEKLIEAMAGVQAPAEPSYPSAPRLQSGGSIGNSGLMQMLMQMMQGGGASGAVGGVPSLGALMSGKR